MNSTVNASDFSSNDEQQSLVTPQQRRPRRLLVSLAVALALGLIGAAALSDVAANVGDVVKILGVFAFIGLMLTLAVGMVGDAYRS